MFMNDPQRVVDINGTWRFETGSPVFHVVFNSADRAAFLFNRVDGDRQSFHGHGRVDGETIVISWRSTLWLGHGSDESSEIKFDPISGKPIEIHWKGGSPAWLTVSN